MRASIWLAVLLASIAVGCGEKVDLTKGLQVLDVSTGWLDAGLVKGQNKLVPTASFKLKNVSNQQLNTVQVNAVFRRMKEDDEFGSDFVKVGGPEGLPPGATSETITVKSQLGYTGIEPRNEMLSNSKFVDAKVQIFAKYGSTLWVKVAEFPIERRLITR
jgi:hypothetical protein